MVDLVRTNYEYEKMILEKIKEKYLKLIGDVGLDKFIPILKTTVSQHYNYDIFRDLCSFIFYDETLHRKNPDCYFKVIDFLNIEATKYLGDYFVETAKYIWNNIRLYNNIIDNDRFDIYKVFCRVYPGTNLSKAIIAATRIIAYYSDKVIIGKEYNIKSCSDLLMINQYLLGNITSTVYKEKYDKIDLERFAEDKEYENNINQKIFEESKKNCEEWIKYIDLVKDKRYKDANNLIINNFKDIDGGNDNEN